MAKQDHTTVAPTSANIWQGSPEEWRVAQLANQVAQRNKEPRWTAPQSRTRPRGVRNRIQPKPIRQLTIQRAMSGIHPMLRLAGWWLEDAGFPQGTRVIVKVGKRKLVITPEAPPRPRHAATLTPQPGTP